MKRNLNKPGQFDYDFKNDILFFKVKEREYSHSVELSSLVIDFDAESFIVGLQIINASEVLQISKENLRGVSGFKMNAVINGGAIRINLIFKTTKRNKTEIMPIIFDRVDEEIPNSSMFCVAK